MSETETEMEAGIFHEQNYFPEDVEYLNKQFGGRVVVIDDATQKDFEAIMAMEPYQKELGEQMLKDRVMELHKEGWVLLMAPIDDAPMWRGLLGRALYKQMAAFKIFVGLTNGEQRVIHFFMIKKTPEFKRNIRKFKNVFAGEKNDYESSGTPMKFNAEYLKRLFCIADDPAQREKYPGGKVNFMGTTKEAQPELLSQLVSVILE
jgi:hypothetical protein